MCFEPYTESHPCKFDVLFTVNNNNEVKAATVVAIEMTLMSSRIKKIKRTSVNGAKSSDYIQRTV